MGENCIYCGTEPATTRDHVPPKGLFPQPRPSDLVTVPCCEMCRKAQSLDDEYFIRMVAMRHDVGEHPAARQIVEAVHRSFAKSKKQAFAQALVDSVRYVDLYSKAGLYLGKTATYDVDFERLCAVIRRTTLGLFYERLGERLSDDYRCDVYAIDGFVARDPGTADNLHKLVDLALCGEMRAWGEKVFTAWFQQVQGPPQLTFWAFLVYSRVAFLALTCPAASDL